MRHLVFLAMLLPNLALAHSYVLKESAEAQVITVKEAIALALARNIPLKKTAAFREEARAKKYGAISKLLPDLKLQSSLQLEPKPQATKAGLELTLPLIDAKSWAGLKAARESALAASFDYEHESDNLTYEVARLYGEALIARSMRNVLKEGLLHFEKQAQSLANKARVGTARQLDLLEAQYQFAKAENDHILKVHLYEQKLGELGLKIAKIDTFELAVFEVSSPYLTLDQESLLAMAMDSDDMKALKKEISSHRATNLSDRFELLPRLFASLESSHESGLAAAPSGHIMLNLSWSLFGLNNVAKMQISKAGQSISELKYAQKRLEKELSVYSALKQIKSYEESIKSDERLLDLAHKTSASTERVFNSGEKSGIDLIEAQLKVFSAKSLLLENQLNLTLSKLRLLFLIGKIREL